VKELMNLERLQWTKNVKPAEGWAYCEFKKGELFKLAWKDDEANANRLERGDLILLRQHGYVTHIVKVLNRQAEREDWQSDWNLYRIVEVVWAIYGTTPSASAKADLRLPRSSESPRWQCDEVRRLADIQRCLG
jgi:hypothetical protein